jgi:hypothetical protein
VARVAGKRQRRRPKRKLKPAKPKCTRVFEPDLRIELLPGGTAVAYLVHTDQRCALFPRSGPA